MFPSRFPPKFSTFALMGMLVPLQLLWFFSPRPAQAQNTFESYHRQCLERVARVGLRGAAAKAVCDCTINEFKKRYSLAQFTRLVQQSETDPRIARQLAEVGEECLYE